MQSLKKIVRFLPVEFFVVFLTSVLFFTGFLVAVRVGLIPNDLKTQLNTNIFFGDRFFAFLKIIYLYLFVRGVVYIICVLRAYQKRKLVIGDFLKKVGYFCRSLLFWISIIIFYLFCYTFIIRLVFRMPSTLEVIHASDLLMSFDYFLFGVYPPFWLQQFLWKEPLGYLNVLAYKEITFVVTLVVLVCIFTNTKALRKFLMAFIIASFVGIPFWIAVPAISPQGMYIDNILKSDVSLVEKQIKNIRIEPNVEAYLPTGYKNWVDPKGKSFGVSTFPSMHVAWGLIVTIIGIEVIPVLSIILIPWFVFNFFATMSIFQHYAVDSIMGIFVGLFALCLAGCALKKENSYFDDKFKLLYLWSIFRQDWQETRETFRSAFKLLK